MTLAAWRLGCPAAWQLSVSMAWRISDAGDVAARRRGLSGFGSERLLSSPDLDQDAGKAVTRARGVNDVDAVASDYSDAAAGCD